MILKEVKHLTKKHRFVPTSKLPGMYQADCLVPFQSGEPVSTETTKEDTDHQVILFDLYVPSNQPPGLYNGNIEINLNKQSREYSRSRTNSLSFCSTRKPFIKSRSE